MLATRGMGSESLVTNGFGYWAFGQVVAQAAAVSHSQSVNAVAAMPDASATDVGHGHVIDALSAMPDAIAADVAHAVLVDEPTALPDAVAGDLIHRQRLGFPFSIDGLSRLLLTNETRAVSLADGTVIYVVTNVSRERKTTNVTKQVKVN